MVPFGGKREFGLNPKLYPQLYVTSVVSWGNPYHWSLFRGHREGDTGRWSTSQETCHRVVRPRTGWVHGHGNPLRRHNLVEDQLGWIWTGYACLTGCHGLPFCTPAVLL